MSVEGLWTADFEVLAGWRNGGVVVLETGRIFGGDSQYYYLGKYEVSRGTMTGKVSVTHYHGQAGTAFGDNAARFDVELAGNLTENAVDGKATRSGFPAIRFRMTKKAELP